MIEKISTRQECFVITICRIATILTIMPVIHLGPANRHMAYGFSIIFYTILTSIPLLFLSTKFSDLTIIGYMEMIFGKDHRKNHWNNLWNIFPKNSNIIFFYIATQMIRTHL